eukprot:1808575-Pleurochrysis_carterae.AAC.1
MSTGGCAAVHGGAVGKAHCGGCPCVAVLRRGRRGEERIGGAFGGYRAVKRIEDVNVAPELGRDPPLQVRHRVLRGGGRGAVVGTPLAFIQQPPATCDAEYFFSALLKVELVVSRCCVARLALVAPGGQSLRDRGGRLGGWEAIASAVASPQLV